MKHLPMYFIGILTLSMALPALAGPDFPISRTTHKSSQMEQADCMPKTYTLANGKTLTCPPPALVLPLDHGPHATTTPYENQRRRERYEAQIKACIEVKK